MLKNKGFSLVEILVALVVIGIVTASAMPLMTKMAQNKTGVDKNTIICITESPADWYKATDGTTELPAEDTKCWAAVTDVQHNRGGALETAKWYANNGKTELQKITAKKLLRTACDLGGEKACDYFISGCWKSDIDIPPYCDDEANFLDLTYYLHQHIGATPGAIYIKDRLEDLLTKNITTLIDEVNHSCFNDQKPDHDPGLQNLGNNIACELLNLNIAWWIKQCNNDNEFACEYCYDKQYNRSCYEVRSVWEEADSTFYKLTANGDPGEPDKEPTIEVYCDMTNLASAAISGCGYGAGTPPHVSGDCEAGHINDYNRSCVQVKTEWGAAPTGNFELTHGGAGSPKSVYCNTSTIASAAITGCGYNTDTEGPIPAGEYVPGDCSYGHTESYNLTCDDIFSFWSERPEGHYYNLTAEGGSPPAPGSRVCPSEGPVNNCLNPNGATTIFSATETGLGYDFEVTNCNQADYDNLVANDEVPCPGATCENNEAGCWYGASPDTICDGTGCGNPVTGGTDKYLCTLNGGARACNALNNGVDYGEKNWRLPTVSEYYVLRNPDKTLTDQAMKLDLCDERSGYSSPYCEGFPSGCSGSHNGCYPSHFWLADTTGRYQLLGSLVTDILRDSMPNENKCAFSIRCVRKL